MKNNIKNILIIAVVSLSFGYVVYADPTKTPLDGNIGMPITQLDYMQTKDGSLGVNKFLVGDWKGLPADFVIFTSTGKLGIHENTTSTSALPTITEYLEVGSGKVRLSEISTAGVDVCADSKGTLVKCQMSIFSHSGKDTNPYETFNYIIPDGVKEITVELYGAGGAGYHISASSYDRSPDDYSNCAQGSGGSYSCASGGSAFFYDTNGTTPLLRAMGGHVATAKHTGGTGGATDVSSNSKILSSSTQNGSNGGNGNNGDSKDTSQTTCSQGYTVTNGGNGGVGGYGGNTGTAGKTPGGDGGKGGSSILDIIEYQRCVGEVHSFNNGKGYLSEGGIDGQFGAGGSGAGGIGGYSDRGGDLANDNDSLCAEGATCPGSDQGYAGGGGGGYIKAKVKVTGGQTYKIKLSHGGEVQNITEDKGDVWCYFKSKDICHGGSRSGSGSGAYAKITVN